MMKAFHHQRHSHRFLLSLLLPTSLTAADFNWTGASPLNGGNNNMSNPANWSGPSAPPNTGGTADLIFGGIVRTSPNADVNYTINSIRFTSSQGFTLGGNPITLQSDAGTDPFIRNESAAADRINNSITFNNNGTIFAQSGNLTLGGLFGTGSVAATPNTINLIAGTNRTINLIGNTAGFGSFVKAGAGTLLITGNALNTGPFISNVGLTELSGSTSWSSYTLNAGTVRLLANNRIPTVPVTFSGTASLDLNGFSDTIGPISGAGSITLGGGGQLTVNQNTNTTFTGSITGTTTATSFTKSGTGRLTLVTNSVYSGPTGITGGTLASGKNNSFSAESIHNISAGATLFTSIYNETIGGLSGAGTADLGNGSLTVFQNTDTTFTGNITGSASLLKTGSGTLELTAANPAFTGNTTIANGRVLIRDGGALRNTTVQSGGTLQIGATTTLGSNLNLNLAGTGTGGIGAIRIDALSNAITSAIEGNITLSADTSITQDRASTFGAPLTLGSSSTPGTLALGTHTLTINGNSPSSTIVRHALTGSGAITLAAPRSLFLIGASPSFSGPIDVQQGTLFLNNNQALGTGTSPVTIATNSQLRLGANVSSNVAIASNRPITLSGDFFTNSTSSWTGSGNIQINPGAQIQVTDSGNVFTIGGTGQITGNNTPAYFSAATDSSLLIQRDISLANGHGIFKAGGGILQLNGIANYIGPTQISGGTVRLGTTGAIPAASRVQLSGVGTLDLNNHPTQTAGVSGSGNVILGTATLTLNPTSDLTHSGNISGTGGIEILGNGSHTHSQDFTTANTYTGPTIVRNNGRLLVTAATGNPLSPTAPLTLDPGGTVVIRAPATSVGGLLGSGHIQFQSGGNLTISTNSNSSNFGGSSSGPGSIIKDGDGDTLFLIGATLLHSGQTRVKTGTINKNAATTMPNTHVFVEAAGTFSGFGTFKSFEIDGGTINPGLTEATNVQLTTTETSFFRAGAKYEWKIGDWDGTGGDGHNLIAPQGLQLTTTAAAPLVIRVHAPADLANFTESPRVFKIVRSNTPISASDPTAITVEYSSNAAGLTGAWSARIAGNDLELVYTPTGAGDTYASWIAGFNVGGFDGPADDPDGDGIPNGIEYVIGGNPQNQNDTDKLPASGINGDDFIFVFRRTTRSIYLAPSAHHSTTLEAPWTKAVHGVNGVTITTSALDGQTDEITVRIPLTGAPRRFARLEVTIP